MNDPVIASEMREIRMMEMLEDEPDIPYVDEDAHLDDYNYDCVIYAENHYDVEYNELRSLGLSHKQAVKVMRDE